MCTLGLVELEQASSGPRLQSNPETPHFVEIAEAGGIRGS